ncbi:MAG: molecular chaperone HtpG, partial [Verrucomicrobiota bacterium]
RISRRLVDSPAVVVDADKQTSASMRRILKAVRRDDSTPSPDRYDLEINPSHPILVRLEAIRQKDEPLAKDVTDQVFDNARVAAGILEDPRAMLGRLNQLLEKVLR